jgi:hypothetical protein
VGRHDGTNVLVNTVSTHQKARNLRREDYPWWGGRDQVRVLVTITPQRVRSMG